VSDERDSAGAAGEDVTTGDDTTGGKTAVVTQPLRPTGKRSRRAGTDGDDTESTADTSADGMAAATRNGNGSKPKTAKKPSGASRNPLVYIWTFLKQVVAELRKVIWPNRKQMVSYTSVVLVFLAFMVTLIGLVDLGLAKLVLMALG
jgi:preprotein translocase subunit SecE